MVKQTFLKLSSDRQDAFLRVAFREFTEHNYDNASITSIVKELGLAKGSFYQYFENKRALFQYLMQMTFETKKSYIMNVERDNFESFWDYTLELYRAGLNFDREHPHMSNFAYCLSENLHSPTVQELHQGWLLQGFETIKTMIKKEIDAGNFRNDLPLDSAAMFYMNIGRQLLDQLRMSNLDDFQRRVAEGKPLLADGNEKLLFKILHQNIQLLRAALDKNR